MGVGCLWLSGPTLGSTYSYRVTMLDLDNKDGLTGTLEALAPLAALTNLALYG